MRCILNKRLVVVVVVVVAVVVVVVNDVMDADTTVSKAHCYGGKGLKPPPPDVCPLFLS